MAPVHVLLYALPLPQDPVRPGRRPGLFTGVPVISPRVILIGWPEGDGPLLVADEHLPLVSLELELVILLQRSQVVLGQEIFHFSAVQVIQPVVEISQPEDTVVVLDPLRPEHRQGLTTALLILIECHPAAYVRVVLVPALKLLGMSCKVTVHKTQVCCMKSQSDSHSPLIPQFAHDPRTHGVPH